MFASVCEDVLEIFTYLLIFFFFCSIFMLSAGQVVEGDRRYLYSRFGIYIVWNKHNHVGHVSFTTSSSTFSPSLSPPGTVLCHRIHPVSGSCFSCRSLMMRSLETLGKLAGLNFLWLPLCCQCWSLIDRPAVVGGGPLFSISVIASLCVCVSTFAAFHVHVCIPQCPKTFASVGQKWTDINIKETSWFVKSKARLATRIKRVNKQLMLVWISVFNTV